MDSLLLRLGNVEFMIENIENTVLSIFGKNSILDSLDDELRVVSKVKIFWDFVQKIWIETRPFYISNHDSCALATPH